MPALTGKPKLLTSFGSELAGPVGKLAGGGELHRRDALLLATHGIKFFGDAGETDIEEEARGEPVDGVID